MSLFRKKVITKPDAGQSQLRRVLCATDLVMMGLGAMVGTGIFVVSGLGAVQAGPALTLSFLLAGCACALAALCYAEFAAMIPVAGSSYTYAYASLGELIAWIVGWSLLAEYGLACSSIAVGWSGYSQSLLAGWGVYLPDALRAAPGALPEHTTYFNLPAFCIILAVTLLLSAGVRESKRVSNLMVFIKVSVIILVVAVGIWHVEPDNWTPYVPNGISGVIGASALIIFSFLGFDVVSSAAEEVRRPQRDMPIGLLVALGICIILYIGVAAVLTGIVPYMEFKGIDNPVSLVLARAHIVWLARLVDVAAVVGMAAAILVMCYAITRLVFAISRDGLLPPILSRINHRQVPIFSTWFFGLISALIAALAPLEVLAELINMGTLTAFIVIAVAIPVLRYTQPGYKRTFKVPFSPVTPVLCVLVCLALILNLDHMTWIAFTIWLALGLVLYFGYSRRHSHLSSDQ